MAQNSALQDRDAFTLW